ncbi:MAG: site-specific integrase [Peptococcaceae bacterium]|nr:site-specific integrase [Peptococcaceae bacterium]
MTITRAQIENYLASLRAEGYTADSVLSYRSNLYQFYHALPEDKQIDQHTARHWRDHLLAQGYHPATINQRLSSINSFLKHLGVPEYQLFERLEEPKEVQPALSRQEYLRLLSAAKQRNQLRTYLLIKVFAVLGLSIQELPFVTAEAVAAGQIACQAKKNHAVPTRISGTLKKELEAYMKANGIQKGPVFITEKGTPLNRSTVTTSIQRLAEDARVEPAKCTPRCLRKLCQSTWDDLQDNLSALLVQTYEQMLEQEQVLYGWERVPSFGRSS